MMASGPGSPLLARSRSGSPAPAAADQVWSLPNFYVRFWQEEFNELSLLIRPGLGPLCAFELTGRPLMATSPHIAFGTADYRGQSQMVTSLDLRTLSLGEEANIGKLRY